MKKFLKLFFVGGLVAASGVVGTNVAENMNGSVAPADAARRNAPKVTICHRTNSVTNPYRRITVSRDSIIGPQGQRQGHRLHDARINPQYPVFNPTPGFYQPTAKNWGDIIPGGDAEGLLFNGEEAFKQNWDDVSQTSLGKSFMVPGGANVQYCRKMSAKEYYDSEVAALPDPSNPSPQELRDITDDLQDQEANEDKALKNACNGNWANCDPTTWNNLVKVETKDPSDVTKTAAKLNGVVTCGADATGTPVKYFFQWGTDPALASLTETTATAVAQNGQTVTVEITGLSDGTYYYRVVCVTDYELETEGVLEGTIKNFSIDANTPVAVPSTPTTTPGNAGTVVLAKGKLAGVVWLELKKDAKLQSGEPLLGQYVVTLRRNGTVVSTKSTGSKGEFEFADLEPGTYVVTVTLADGSPFVRSSDTDGGTDWVVSVVVKASETSFVEYAAVGNAKTGGKAIRLAGGSSTVIPKAKVTCSWAGLDGKLGTADDVDFTTTAGADGTYLIKGIPTGKYSCVAVDPVTKGKTTVDSVKVTAASAKKSDAAVKTALLKISAAGATLPATGSDLAQLLWIVAGGVLLGAFMWSSARRRQRRA